MFGFLVHGSEESIFTMATGRLRKYHQIAADEGGSTDVKSQTNQQQSRVPASLSWDSGYNEGNEAQESFIIQMMNMPSVVVSDCSDTVEFVEAPDPSSKADNKDISQQPISPTPSSYSLSNCSHFVEQTDRQHWSWSTSTSLRSSHPPGLLVHLPIQPLPDDESSYLSVRRLSDCSSSSSIASQASNLYIFECLEIKHVILKNVLHLQDTLDMEPCCSGSCNDVSSFPIYHSNLDLDADVTVPEIVADEEKDVRDSNSSVPAAPKEESSHHPNKVSPFSLLIERSFYFV